MQLSFKLNSLRCIACDVAEHLLQLSADLEVVIVIRIVKSVGNRLQM